MTRVALLFLALAGCGGHECYPTEDAAWDYAALVHVWDATNQNIIPNPTFAIEGVAQMPFCYDHASTDLASEVCPGWAFDGPGNYTLDVDAPGYLEGSVAIDNDYMIDGCPAEGQLEVLVQLKPAP